MLLQAWHAVIFHLDGNMADRLGGDRGWSLVGPPTSLTTSVRLFSVRWPSPLPFAVIWQVEVSGDFDPSLRLTVCSSIGRRSFRSEAPYAGGEGRPWLS